MKVLLIEDNISTQYLFAQVLKSLDHEVETFIDAEAAWDSYQREPCPLIVTDWMLPGMSGLELCQKVRSTPTGAGTVVLVVTSRHEKEDLEAVLAAGADDYLTKPVEVSTLRIRLAIAQQRVHILQERLAAQGRVEQMIEQLEKSNEDLQSILHQLPQGTALTDREGRITFLNQLATDRLFAGRSEAVLGLSWRTVFPFEPEIQQALETLAETPTEDREKISARVEGLGRQSYWIDIEVQDDPRDPQSKIFMFDDVSEMYDLRRQIDEKAQFHDLVGHSKSMTVVYQQINEVAKADWTVLIHGETGTGKELVAKAIHSESHRAHKPFLAVNCAGLTDTLVGSQLFGHARGAFTGAVGDHQGVLEAAEGGTLLLDEIGDIPLDIQGSLLRVLQEREVTRLGENNPRKIDVRILAATHRDLSEEVEQGRFREDLLYRLRIARINLPPLRERREDIPVLAATFLRECSAATGKNVREISPQAMGLLMDYRWPGNVRELKNAIEFALFRCSSAVLQPQDLPPEIPTQDPTRLLGAPEQQVQGLAPFPSNTPTWPANQQQGVAAFFGSETLSERERILAALERTHGNRTAAARLLGISRATFYRRLTELGIGSK